MPEADNNNLSLRNKLPSLALVEDEGKAAVETMAQAFVRQALRNGGRIDVQRLQRAGPSVEAAYRRRLAQIAARSVAPLNPEPARPADGRTARPRTVKGWRDRCCQAPDFKAAARRRGRIVGAIATVVALAAVRLLEA